VLGTDCETRSPENLYAKSEVSVRPGLMCAREVAEQLPCWQSLCNDALTAYMYTGSYAVPPRTITGSVRRDMMLIKSVVGLGEVGRYSALLICCGEGAEILLLPHSGSDIRPQVILPQL
jgi:hypothetical protein